MGACLVSLNREGRTMMKIRGFEVVLASPSNYDYLTAEIYFDGKFVALISQERGTDQFDLETPGPGLKEALILRKIDLNGFKNAIELACKRLQGKIE